MDNQNLLLGIEEAKKGNYEKASGYLAKAVRSDPTNIDGWLFLGHCLSDVEKRRYCYQRALTIDPQNEVAKTSLAGLDKPQKLEPPTSETAGSSASQESSAGISVDDQPSKLNKPNRGGVISAFMLGFMLAILICVMPSSLLLMSGKFDMYLMGKFLMPGVMAQMTTSTPNLPQDQNGIDAYIVNAKQAMDNKDYEKAIPYLDKAIDLAPKNYLPYAMRAKCFFEMTTDERSLDVYNSNLQKALTDIDLAISLHTEEAELYSLRRDIIVYMSLVTTNHVDNEYLIKSAIDNGRKFLSLSSSLERRLRISALLAGDLINIGQCNEGMQMVEDLKKKVQPGDNPTYGSLMVSMAAGYACQGDMDKAVQSMDEIMSKSNGYLKPRVYFRSLYLYQAGKTQQALDALNVSINSDPTFAGNRYFLRALIDLDMGDKEKAVKDLNMGESYTWDRSAVYAYTKAKIAILDENKADAVYWLQDAEAACASDESVLHKKILEELSQLGAQPLELSIDVNIQTTPMPPVTPIP